MLLLHERIYVLALFPLIAFQNILDLSKPLDVFNHFVAEFLDSLEGAVLALISLVDERLVEMVPDVLIFELVLFFSRREFLSGVLDHPENLARLIN